MKFGAECVLTHGGLVKNISNNSIQCPKLPYRKVDTSQIRVVKGD